MQPFVLIIIVVAPMQPKMEPLNYKCLHCCTCRPLSKAIVMYIIIICTAEFNRLVVYKSVALSASRWSTQGLRDLFIVFHIISNNTIHTFSITRICSTLILVFVTVKSSYLLYACSLFIYVILNKNLNNSCIIRALKSSFVIGELHARPFASQYNWYLFGWSNKVKLML